MENIIDWRNLVRVGVTQDYTSLIQNMRDVIIGEIRNNPRSGNETLRRYHRQIIDRYQRDLESIAVLGVAEGQTGPELLSFVTDLEAQLSAIDRIYGLV